METTSNHPKFCGCTEPAPHRTKPAALGALVFCRGCGNAIPSCRRIDGKFHVSGGEVVKTSSGEIVPHDEPLWLVRGRDYLAVAAIEHYEVLCRLDGCNDFQAEGISGAVAEFKRFAADHPERMKQPGITRGKPWTGEAPGPPLVDHERRRQLLNLCAYAADVLGISPGERIHAPHPHAPTWAELRYLLEGGR